MFPYRLDHRHVDESKVLDGWSYLLTSPFGPLYVAYHRFWALALLMLAISLVIGGIAAGALTILLLFASVELRTIAIVVMPIAALLIQGLAALEIVLTGYLQRGWREGY